MSKVQIFDTTLRDGEQCPGGSMTLSEKLRVAERLALLNVDVIEAGFPASSVGDFESVAKIARQIHGPIICGLARTIDVDIDRCWEAVRHSSRPRVHTFIATSDLHITEKLRMTRESVVVAAVRAVARAKAYGAEVEFSLEDATRTDYDYMCLVIEAVINAGATIVNIPDTVGYADPWSYGDRIAHIFANVPNIGETVFSAHCHNDLGQAVANSLAAIHFGARQVECTINGIGERAGNTALEELVMSIKTQPFFSGRFSTGIETKHLYGASRLVVQVTDLPVQSHKAVVGRNAFAHEAGIHQAGMIANRQTYEIMNPEDVGWQGEGLVLGKHSGRRAFAVRLAELGIKLDDQEFKAAFDAMKALADERKSVYASDLVAIARDHGFTGIPETFRLEAMTVVSSTHTTPMATIKIAVNGKTVDCGTLGVGPVDAVYNAIFQATGLSAKLVSFGLRATAEGTDSPAEVQVKIGENGHSVVGIAGDDDVVKASVNALLDAMNRLEAIKEAEAETSK
ncbi:MAG: 2-isopropylmalate synthase [Patescibacteria group bacterium]|nr:2-isopropylmalate synthase [Patescibacteria group bacterium]